MVKDDKLKVEGQRTYKRGKGLEITPQRQVQNLGKELKVTNTARSGVKA